MTGLKKIAERHRTEDAIRNALTAERLKQAAHFVREARCGIGRMNTETRDQLIELARLLSDLETRVRDGLHEFDLIPRDSEF